MSSENDFGSEKYFFIIPDIRSWSRLFLGLNVVYFVISVNVLGIYVSVFPHKGNNNKQRGNALKKIGF